MTQSRIIGDVRWAGEGTRGCAGGRRRPCGCHGLQRGGWPDRGAARSIVLGGIDRVPEHVDHDDVQDDDDHLPRPCLDLDVDLVRRRRRARRPDDDLHHLHDLVDVTSTSTTIAAPPSTPPPPPPPPVTGVAAQQQKLNELFYGLGFPGLTVDGDSGRLTEQQLCAARVALGMPISRADMDPAARRSRR